MAFFLFFYALFRVLQDPRWPRYKALDEDGICRVGARLDPGTIMVNKHSPASTSGMCISPNVIAA